MGYTQPHSRTKSWEFYVPESAIAPLIEPVIAAAFPEGATRPGVDRFGAAEGTLNDQRTWVLAELLSAQIGCGAIDFHYDPDAGDEPSIVRADLENNITRFFDGEFDPFAFSNRPAAKPLFNDDFADPAVVKALISGVVTAVADAIAAGTVDVNADEPFDSCRNCGGYHNVNLDC